MSQPDAFAHAVNANHLAGEHAWRVPGRFRAPVVTSSNTISSAARPPSIPRIRSSNSASRHEELVFGRQLHGVAERGASARNDADLVDRIGMLAVRSNQRVADFVIGDAALVLRSRRRLLRSGPATTFSTASSRSR